MNGSKALLDTNIIIYASKQLIDISFILDRYDSFLVSVITYMEVYGYEFESPDEKALIDTLFSNLEIVSIDGAIADQTIEYRRNKVRKIKLPDAIILATAKQTGADLITADWDDFMGFDDNVKIVVVRP